MKRGTIRKFREYLNAKYSGSANWKHNRFHQSSREYGDYLYHQDRAMFDVYLNDALNGGDKFSDFKA